MSKPRPNEAAQVHKAEAQRLYQAGKLLDAEGLLHKALGANPHDPQALLLLGLVEAGTGRLQVAAHHLNQSVNCDPNQAASRAALAKTLASMGHHFDAIPQFQAALQINPSAYEAAFGLAESLVATHRERSAAQILRHVLPAAPNAQGYLILADLERESGRVVDAVTFCRKAIELDPNLSGAHVLLARLLTEQDKTAEAEVHWQRAAELDEPSWSLHLTKAFAFGTVGQFDRTVAELEESIALKPDQGEAYRALAYCRKLKAGDDNLVSQMKALIERSSLSNDDRVSVLYALGKAHDDLGDFEQAIGWFDRANALREETRVGPAFNMDVVHAVVDATIRLFTLENLKNWGNIGVTSRVPILVVGMIRSGTTLVEQMLTCHPKVGGAGEQYYWGENEPSFVDHMGLRVHPQRLLACAREYEEILRSIAPGFERVVDKNPSNFMSVGSLFLAFPNIRIIRVKRNPIDTALSIWTTPMSARAPFVSDRNSIVKAYREYATISKHWRSVLPTDRYTEIVYEDLVTDPETHGRRMVEFCGLEWDDGCLHPEMNPRRIQTPSFWQARQPIYRSSTERWRRYEPWLGPLAELADVTE
ncbi:MAG: sulfotransferase [Fimbriimonas sp.]|nr:sulfotransferase [Fimbriimonas sp.]